MKKHVLPTIFVIFLIFLLSSTIFASQALPRYGINEQTKECSEFFMGDECASCRMPDDWQMIEVFQCPNDYNEIQVNSVCTPSKNIFCCTVQHSGGSGDCDDVIVNDIEQKCAFVEDINKCKKMPTNWNQAEETEYWGNLCPSFEYEWLEDTINCETKIIEYDYIDNQNNIIDDKQQKSNILPIVVIAVALIILFIILLFFIIKQRKK